MLVCHYRSNMKPEYEKIQEPSERSFTAKIVARKSRPLLRQAWHFHPEIEICFTKESFGKRFVGNQISDYFKGDLVMFGSNLPHGFTTDERCTQVVIQMNEHFLGDAFLSKPELRKVRALFQYARRGLTFGESSKKKAKKVIAKIMGKQGFAQMIHLMELLHLLSEATDATPICSEEYSLDLDATHLQRLKTIYEYILLHYKQELSIAAVANHINMTEAAFYKFIKKHTKKTFTEIVNEFRINLATKFLMTTDMSISEVCFACGYNNISYFNRRFKHIVGQTPRLFKQNYQGN